MRWVSYTRSISSRIGEENPANTIAEQNANIEQYLKNKGYRISEKYSDRKRSAEAADGFDRMVQDGMTQKFDAVAVDSIFRFGKTLPFAIEVLQKTFYPVGIQFAVVEDDFCSTDRTADEVEQYFKEKAILRRSAPCRKINGLLRRTPMKRSLQKMSIIRRKRQSAMLLRSNTRPKMILL